MSINKVNSNTFSPSFTARTRISAPPSLLTRTDRNAIIARGRDIGTNSDYININVTEIPQNPKTPEARVYNLSFVSGFSKYGQFHKQSINRTMLYSYNDIIVAKNRPKYIINQHLDELKKRY